MHIITYNIIVDLPMCISKYHWLFNACSQNLNWCITHIVPLSYIMQVIQVLCVGFCINVSNKFCFYPFFNLQTSWFISLTYLHTSIWLTQDTDTKPVDSHPSSCNFPYSYSSREILRCTPDRDTQTGPDKISPARWTRHSAASPKPHLLP